MSKRATYAGNIKNQGSQKVEAPFPAGKKKTKTVKKTGEDLRK